MRKLMILGFLALGCVIGPVETDRCPNDGWLIVNDFPALDGERVSRLEAPPGRCMKVETHRADIRFSRHDDCSEPSSCILLRGAETALVMVSHDSGGTIGERRTAPLKADGTCSLSCAGYE